ncbi:MAG: hypothetical protein ABL986_03215 [Vicinamibacterales bacterium]
MKTRETRKYESLLRIRAFGDTYRDLFPPDSVGGQEFDNVRKAVRELDEQAATPASTSRSAGAWRLARKPLVEQLKRIRQSARAIAEDTPGFADPFEIPNPRTDQRLLATARVFVREAEQTKSRFVAFRMPDTFIDSLKEATVAFEQAISGVKAERDAQTAARVGVEAALSSGLTAVRKLDAIVANTLRDDPKALAIWEQDRQVINPRRARRAAAEPPLESELKVAS